MTTRLVIILRRLKKLTVTNTLAYYNTELITAVIVLQYRPLVVKSGRGGSFLYSGLYGIGKKPVANWAKLLAKAQQVQPGVVITTLLSHHNS